MAASRAATMLYPVQAAQPGFLSVRVSAKANRIAPVPTGTDRMDLGGHPAVIVEVVYGPPYGSPRRSRLQDPEDLAQDRLSYTRETPRGF
jgi:hypothetical protein